MVMFEPTFAPGSIMMTAGVAEHCQQRDVDLLPYLKRHLSADWGAVSAEDWQANNKALKEGTRLLSAYDLPTNHRVWVITEWDRSATTILFPHEY